MTATSTRKSLAGTVILLLMLAASSAALGQTTAGRPFVGGTFFGEAGTLRQGWGIGGGVSAGWVISDTWGAQVEFDWPTAGTEVDTLNSPSCDPRSCLQEKRTRQEPTIAVLFGRHLPAAGRFRATVLLGPAARIDRVTTITRFGPNYFGYMTAGALEP